MDKFIFLNLVIFVVAILSNLLQYFLVDKEKMNKLKEEIKELNKKMKSLSKEETKELNKLMSLSMKKTTDMLILQRKVFLASFLVIIPIFFLLSSYLKNYSLSVFGFNIAWIWYYFIGSLIISSVIRKLMKL